MIAFSSFVHTTGHGILMAGCSGIWLSLSLGLFLFFLRLHL